MVLRTIYETFGHLAEMKKNKDKLSIGEEYLVNKDRDRQSNRRIEKRYQIIRKQSNHRHYTKGGQKATIKHIDKQIT